MKTATRNNQQKLLISFEISCRPVLQKSTPCHLALDLELLGVVMGSMICTLPFLFLIQVHYFIKFVLCDRLNCLLLNWEDGHYRNILSEITLSGSGETEKAGGLSGQAGCHIHNHSKPK